MNDHVINLRFTVDFHCPDDNDCIYGLIDCFNEFICFNEFLYSIDFDILHSACCTLNRLENNSDDC